MRTLLVIIAVWCLCSGVLAADCGNDATSDQIANAAADALRQKRPGDKPVVANAEVAQAIHRAVGGALYGTTEIEGQRPVRAVRSSFGSSMVAFQKTCSAVSPSQ